MITKKLTVGLEAVVLLALIAFWGAGMAEAAGLAFSADTSVTIGAHDYTIESGSEATSIVNDGTTLTVVIPALSTFTFSSADGYHLGNDVAAAVTCDSGTVSSIVVTGATTVVITPDANTVDCATGGSSSSSSGGGGGGGSRRSSSASSNTTTATTPSAATTAQYESLIGQLRSLVALLEARGVAISAQVRALLNMPPVYTPAVQGTFMRDLTVGASGADVTALQNWLIQKGYSIPKGATGYFGEQTKAAVAAYQAANGITPAVGMFGPKTRAYVEAHP